MPRLRFCVILEYVASNVQESVPGCVFGLNPGGVASEKGFPMSDNVQTT